MGGGSSKEKQMRKDIRSLRSCTHFTMEELAGLMEQFNSISSRREDDGLIDKREFKDALGLQDSLFVDRIFRLFDQDGNGVIDFKEFVKGLNVFAQTASQEEKLRFSFAIYDFDGNGYISQEELYRLLEASLFENDLSLSEEQLYELVEATFAEVDEDRDGSIGFEDYKKLCQRFPSIISSMTITAPILSGVSERLQKKN